MYINIDAMYIFIGLMNLVRYTHISKEESRTLTTAKEEKEEQKHVEILKEKALCCTTKQRASSRS